MMRLFIRRFLIIFGILGILFTLEISTEQSLLMTIPESIDIIQALISEKEQKAAIEKALSAYLENKYETIQEQIALEQQRLLEEKLAAEKAYTLSDRDKPQDYQNLFDNTIKHMFVVDFDSAEWQGLIADMESYNALFGTYRSNNYRKVDVTYYAQGEKVVIPDVGIRSKGNIFSRYPPVDDNGNVRPIHYVLKFNETFDLQEGSHDYELLKKREVFDLEKLAFKWNRNGDSTYLSEVYSMQVFREAGVPAPNMSLTMFVIRIDGIVVQEELYTVQEIIDEEFIRKQIQETPTKEVGDLYKVIWPGTLEPINDISLVGIRDWETNTRPVYGLETNEEIHNYAQLIQFTKLLDEPDLAMRKLYIERYINVDNLIRAFAVSVFLGNPDDYRGNANNYYLYFDETGRVTYIPYDFDHSLGQGWDGAPVFINYTLGNDIYIWEGDGFGEATRNIPLIDHILLSYPEYQILYENYLEQFITDKTFSYEGFSELFDMANTLYGNDVSMYNDKAYYINTKIDNVLVDIAQYRELRNNG